MILSRKIGRLRQQSPHTDGGSRRSTPRHQRVGSWDARAKALCAGRYVGLIVKRGIGSVYALSHRRRGHGVGQPSHSITDVQRRFSWTSVHPCHWSVSSNACTVVVVLRHRVGQAPGVVFTDSLQKRFRCSKARLRCSGTFDPSLDPV